MDLSAYIETLLAKIKPTVHEVDGIYFLAWSVGQQLWLREQNLDANVMAEMLAKSLCDKDGNLVLSKEQVLEKVGFAKCFELIQIMAKKNGDEALAIAKKNSNEVPSDNSSSD